MLSGKEVSQVAGRGCKVIPYSALRGYKTIESVFGNAKAVVILMEWVPHEGHWIVVTKSSSPAYSQNYERVTGKKWDGKPIISVFNSYGRVIDYELRKMTPEWREDSHQNSDYLGQLLNNYPGIVEYNEVPLQTMSKSDNCCGRYSGYRARTSDIPLMDFQRFFHSMSPEERTRKIVELTDPYI
jgi:hypothetical protein